MSSPIISVENLSKAYRIGVADEKHDTLAATLASWVKAPFRNLKRLSSLNTSSSLPTPSSPLSAPGSSLRAPRSPLPASDIHWALRDVTFEVNEGEVVGIIGHNGAGKSTLLKVLSRITDPTSGRVVIRGRVSSLLEVGTGFHPELSGRDNIYMNGTILGMRKREIDGKFDEIVEFSGVERFIDTPVKRYSSGMKVRLAFAVAAHLEPEILIIDEVLAVGDTAFQSKCLNKMQDVSTSGRTVLFVSHNLAAVRTLCTRTLVLQGGVIIEDDVPEEGIRSYHASLADRVERTNRKLWGTEARPGNEFLSLHSAEVTPLVGAAIEVSSGFCIKICVQLHQRLPGLDLTIELKNSDDVVVYHGGTVFVNDLNCGPNTFEVELDFPGYLLNSGRYTLRVVFGQHGTYAVFKLADILAFEIAHTAFETMTPRKGIIRPRLETRCRIV